MRAAAHDYRMDARLVKECKDEVSMLWHGWGGKLVIVNAGNSMILYSPAMSRTYM